MTEDTGSDDALPEEATKETEERVREAVRSLLKAENGPGGLGADYIVTPDNSPDTIRAVANDSLSSVYLPVVRGKGQVDRDRNHTIENIVGASSKFVRHVGRSEIAVSVFRPMRMAIARTLLPTTDSREDPPVQADYRNLQVFIWEKGAWRCLAWQVTLVKNTEQVASASALRR